MKSKRCSACGRPFQPRTQNPKQSYCSDPDCQRERRRKWLRAKLQSDPDYQENQGRAQRAWIQRNPDYWAEYRKSHPEYVARNRALQQPRNTVAKETQIAKMNASIQHFPFVSGIYHLRLIPDTGIAKMDAWTVEITPHSCQSVPKGKIAKR